MITTQFTKGDTIAILATARKNVEDNLKPYRFATQLGLK
jgi:hypothetical protein